jgi:hypothetical protein
MDKGVSSNISLRYTSHSKMRYNGNERARRFGITSKRCFFACQPPTPPSNRDKERAAMYTRGNEALNKNKPVRN